MTSRSVSWALLSLLFVGCTREPLQVSLVVYAAYGTPAAVHVQGRALEAEDRATADSSDSRARNLGRTLDDLEDPFRHRRVQEAIEGIEQSSPDGVGGTINALLQNFI